MHNVNRWNSKCEGNLDRWKNESQIDQKVILQCKLQSGDEKNLPKDQKMILQSELRSRNNY